jgi:DMSO/TMAO reductase YedYZ molybdopterin-dependent catalytic subunit
MSAQRLMMIGLFSAALAVAQEAPASLQVTGAVEQVLKLTADDLARMPRATAKLVSHGKESVYQGVRLHEVLQRVGVPNGKELRGKALAGYVLAEAQDGYRALFSLAELDPDFIDNEILLADSADGKPLSGAEGPFRIIVPKDKPGARSVRMLTKREAVQVSK